MKRSNRNTYFLLAMITLLLPACGGGDSSSKTNSRESGLVLDCGGAISLEYPGKISPTSCRVTYNDNTVSETDYVLTYASGNESIISVSGSGVITPLGVGNTTLKFTIEYISDESKKISRSQTVNIQVKKGNSTLFISCVPSSIAIDYREGEYLPNCNGQAWNAISQSYEYLVPTVEQRENGIFSIAYSVEDSNIAEVSEEGIIKAINPGNTTLHVTFSYDEDENGYIEEGETTTTNIDIISKKFTDNVALYSSEESIWLSEGSTKRIDITATDINNNLTNIDCTVIPVFSNTVSVEPDNSTSTNDIWVFKMTGISKGYDYGFFECQGEEGIKTSPIIVQVKDPVDIPNPTGITKIGDNPDIISSSESSSIFITSYSSTEQALVKTEIAGTVTSQTLDVLNSQESGIKSSLIIDPSTQQPLILTISNKSFNSTLDQISFNVFGTSFSTEVDNDLGYYTGSTQLDSATSQDGSYRAAVATTNSGLNLYQKTSMSSSFELVGEVLPGTITDVALSISSESCGSDPIIAACTAENGLLVGLWNDNDLEFYKISASCDEVDMSVGLDNRITIVANQSDAFTSGEELKYYAIEGAIGQATIDSLENGAAYQAIDLEMDQMSMPRVAVVVTPNYFASSNKVYHYSMRLRYSGMSKTARWVRDELETGFSVGNDIGLTIDRKNASGMVIEGSEGILKYVSQPSFTSYSNNTAPMGYLPCSSMAIAGQSPIHIFSKIAEE